MITTNDDGLAKYTRCLRSFGAGGDYSHIIEMGNDWMMTEINALLGIYQLRVLENNLARRNEIASRYCQLLENSEGLKTFAVPPYIRHSYYKLPVMLPPGTDKKKLIEMMKDQYSIMLGSVYDPPVHLQPVYRMMHGCYPGMFPVAESTLGRVCCLPVFPQMTDEMIRYVVDSIEAVLPQTTAKAVEVQ